MLLETPRLWLRDIGTGDIEAIHELHSLPETDEYNTLGLPDNIQVTRDIIGEWLLRSTAIPRISYTMAIVLKSSASLIGLLGMNLDAPKKKSAEVWYKLHKDHWRKGYATEALDCMLHFAFHDLALHRIEAGCAVNNTGSIKVLEKAGMQREGHCRKILPIRGAWVDNYMYAILEEDYWTGKQKTS